MIRTGIFMSVFQIGTKSQYIQSVSLVAAGRIFLERYWQEMSLLQYWEQVAKSTQTLTAHVKIQDYEYHYLVRPYPVSIVQNNLCSTSNCSCCLLVQVQFSLRVHDGVYKWMIPPRFGYQTFRIVIIIVTILTIC